MFRIIILMISILKLFSYDKTYFEFYKKNYFMEEENNIYIPYRLKISKHGDLTMSAPRYYTDYLYRDASYEPLIVVRAGKNNQEGFIRLLNIDMVDFEELKRILMEKYGIDFNVSYGERVFAETKVNGSEDRISSAVCIFNVIDSHMAINGNVKQLISEQGTKTL